MGYISILGCPGTVVSSLGGLLFSNPLVFVGCKACDVDAIGSSIALSMSAPLS